MRPRHKGRTAIDASPAVWSFERSREYLSLRLSVVLEVRKGQQERIEVVEGAQNIPFEQPMSLMPKDICFRTIYYF